MMTQKEWRAHGCAIADRIFNECLKVEDIKDRMELDRRLWAKASKTAKLEYPEEFKEYCGL